MTEIITRQGVTPDATVEPSLTLSQLSALLRDAAALERAQRPIILTGPAQPVSAPQTAGHPGINVTIPDAAAPAPEPSARRTFTRAELFGWCGIWTGASAAGGIVADAITGSAYVTLGAILTSGLLVSFGAAIVSNHDDDRRQAAAPARRA
jgi:hypothetical protein